MNKQFTIFLLVLLFSLAPMLVSSQTNRQNVVNEVTIDLQNVTREKDRVRVTALPATMNSRIVDYSFPTSIPGVYGELNATSFIHEIRGVDDKGAHVRVKRRGNSFRFYLRKGRSLKRIEYWVDDVFDPGKISATSAVIPQASATRFDAGTEFMLQPAFMIGRFSGAPTAAYQLSILHPVKLFPTSALHAETESSSRDKFFSANYTHLIDHPVHYGTPDTLTTEYGHINLHIAVTGTRYEGRARIIRRILSPQLSALQQLTVGSAPLTFTLLYRFDEGNEQQMRWSGAEHEGSGYFCLPDLADENQIARMVSQQCEGSLYRMLPLFTEATALSPDQLFGGSNAVPEMWWFSNGMSTYMNLLAAVRDSSMSEDAFMENLRAAIQLADQAPTISFTDQKALAKALARPDQAAALRARALVTVFLLDIQLINSTPQQSNGLIPVFLALHARHSSATGNHSLLKQIEQSSGNDASSFFSSYVYRAEKLPLVNSLELIGWAYAPDAIDSVLSFGNFTLQYSESNDAFYVRTAEADNLFGLRPGDRILSVNGVIAGIDNFDYAMSPVYHPEEGQSVTLRYVRGLNNDERTAIPLLREELVRHFVRIDPAARHQAVVNRYRLLHSDLR